MLQHYKRRSLAFTGGEKAMPSKNPVDWDGQPTACMPQVVQAASVCHMWLIEEGAKNRAADQAESRKQPIRAGLGKGYGVNSWHACQRGWPPLIKKIVTVAFFLWHAVARAGKPD